MTHPRTLAPGLALVLAGVFLCLSTFARASEDTDWKRIRVSVSAYNSVASQTKKHRPSLTAWGDTLKPGMRAIAVSRDLIKRGLTYGTRVRIKGLSGTYVVRDKMSRRWHEKIDVYMGRNIEKAREWGVKKNVPIQYTVVDNDD